MESLKDNQIGELTRIGGDAEEWDHVGLVSFRARSEDLREWHDEEATIAVDTSGRWVNLHHRVYSFGGLFYAGWEPEDKGEDGNSSETYEPVTYTRVRPDIQPQQIWVPYPSVNKKAENVSGD